MPKDGGTWRALYRFAVSSYFVDPFDEEIYPGEGFDLLYKCETSLSTGAGFLSHEDFDLTIGPYIKDCSELLAVEVATYVAGKVTNPQIATAECCAWDDYNAFQTRQLFSTGLNLGLAIFDKTRKWVLIKDPDIVYFFVADSGNSSTV